MLTSKWHLNYLIIRRFLSFLKIFCTFVHLKRDMNTERLRVIKRSIINTVKTKRLNSREKKTQRHSICVIIICFLSLSILQINKTKVSNDYAMNINSNDIASIEVIPTTKNNKLKFIQNKIKLLNPKADYKVLAKLILNTSKKHSLDPLIILSVINSESSFKTSAKSYKGAKGLMQLMPATAKYISKLSNIKLKSGSHVYKPEMNINLGSAYLKYLDKKYKGNKKLALMAYNWGPGNVNKALRNKKKFIKPVSDYAHKIINRYNKWNLELNSKGFA